MGIGRHPAVGVLDQHEIAKARHLIARVDDLAGRGGVDRQTFGRANIDAVVAPADTLHSKRRDDFTANRPDEASTSGVGHGKLRGGVGLRRRSG